MIRKNIAGESVEERISPDNYMFGRHFFAYEIAKTYIPGESIVLEAGSGDGYGSTYLSLSCKHVIGIDIDFEPLEQARQKYDSRKLSFAQASVLELPVADKSVDVVCSMQVIEHLDTPETYLGELRRVVKDNGTVIITTPYRESTGWRFDQIPSPFHVIEYTKTELEPLLETFFRSVEIKGIKFHPNSAAGKSDTDLGKFRSLDPLNLRRHVPVSLKPFLYGLVGFKPIGEIQMSSSDFELADEISDEVLDLIAICR